MFQLVTDLNYDRQMRETVEPYLAARGTERSTEREPGKTIAYVRYLAENPRGVMMISHGFTENYEKYKEICYYFVREGFHVYMPDHCGHGKSYRLTEDLSLVHVDHFQRYVDDFLFLTKLAREEQPELPVYLFGHSMGGGIAAACAAQLPGGYRRVILSSPMIRPKTYGVPYVLSRVIASAECALHRADHYVIGTHSYEQPDSFENSASLSKARFSYYIKKQYSEPLYHTCAPSYGWAHEAIRLNGYLTRKGFRTITAPVLLFQAGKDTFVDNAQQNKFAEKINGNGITSCRLICIEGSKHEIFNANDEITEKYWEEVFRFLNEQN